MLEKLAKQTAIYGISTIVVRFLNYLLTPYYTRIFDQGEYGIVTDIYALIPFALVLLSMGMESSFFRFTTRAEEQGGDIAEGKRKVFASTWGVTSLNAAIFFFAVLLLNAPISRAMGEAYVQHPEYVTIVAAIVMVDVWTMIPFSRLREQGRAMHFVMLKALSVLLNVGLAIGFGIAGLYATDFGVGWVLIANLIASIVTLLALLPTTNRIVPRIDWGLMRQIFVYSVPLLISGIAGTANEFIDRQMIKYLAPGDSAEAMAQLGIYGAIVKIAVVMTLFTQMYRLAAEPFFLAGFKKEEFKEANAASMKYFVMASMVIFLGIVLFSDLFALIVGRDFREGIDILPIVLASNVMAGVWFNLSFWYKREEKTKYAAYITFLGLAVTILLSFVLVPKMGYRGAAWVRLVAEATMMLFSYALCRKHYPIPYDLRGIGEYLALTVAIYLTSEYALKPLGEGIHLAGNVVLFSVAICFAVWREKIDIRALARAVIGKFIRR
ncbi:MAG: polysaccharide biosynthesis protein [Rikenellaceae bacterium]|nr:polysaccharide biosynthesis protein [Rikenellaceae bacterium]